MRRLCHPDSSKRVTSSWVSTEIIAGNVERRTPCRAPPWPVRHLRSPRPGPKLRGKAPGPTKAGRPTFLRLTRANMIEELKQKLGAEVEKLQHELNVTLPNEIRKAVELGDLRENSEYKAALERQQFVQARLGQLRQRLSKLSQIDLAQIPADKVGLGSRVVVEDEATKTVETYNLVFGDSVEFEEGHVSMASPIGRALVGKGVGDVALLKLPTMLRRLKITELTTIHQQASA